MQRSLQGRYVKVASAGEAFNAFVPAPLPPKPAIDWTPALRARFDGALLALGKLDALTDLLPNASLLLYAFVRKEAVLSSMIEGTQSSLADLLLYEIHEQPGVPIEDAREVSQAALAHVQFETIHPFLDGNGRVGRLLIALQLANDGLLQKPLLYVSLHFKEHRQTYYELLNRARESGDWETWLEFFADAVVAGATQAAASAMRLLELASADARRIERLGRAAASALTTHRALQRQPIATAASLAAATRMTPATVNKSLAHLERLGVVSELTGKQRGRIFSYASYIGILNEGMARPAGAR